MRRPRSYCVFNGLGLDSCFTITLVPGAKRYICSFCFLEWLRQRGRNW